jgi:hypothetical protein
MIDEEEVFAPNCIRNMKLRKFGGFLTFGERIYQDDGDNLYEYCFRKKL